MRRSKQYPDRAMQPDEMIEEILDRLEDLIAKMEATFILK